jgi:pimeloyl-ACP methyl ester carboxylesterase
MISTNDGTEPSITKTNFDIYGGQTRLKAQHLGTEPGINNGPTLVFLHEGLGSIAQWKTFPGDLCRTTGCAGFLYERFGYGMPEAPSSPDSDSDPASTHGLSPWPLDYLEKEARILDEILEICEVKNPLLIGHSDGGTIALIHAAMHSRKLVGVITEAAHIFVEEITIRGISRVVSAYERGGLKEKLARYHGERTDSVFRRWSERWLDPQFRSWNMKNLLGSITCPVLVIQGRKDEFATLAQVEGIKNGVSGPVKTAIIDGARHIPHLQAEQRVLRKMGKFIPSLDT